MEAWRNGKQIKCTMDSQGFITIQPWKWWKPRTWRNGVKKGQAIAVIDETEFALCAVPDNWAVTAKIPRNDGMAADIPNEYVMPPGEN